MARLQFHRHFWQILFAFALVANGAEQDRNTARKLLDGAVQMSASLHPETGVVALFRAGIAVAALDQKASIELLNRSFSALPSLPNDDLRDEYALIIVRAAASIHAQAATDLLRQLPRPAPAASSVVKQLLGEKLVDPAMELLALLPSGVEYPYEAASYVIAYLPVEDPRRAISFARATSAFARFPAGPFPLVVERFGKQMPAELRTRAISLMLLRIEAWKDSSESFSGSADNNEGRPLEIHSPQQNELRELVSVTRMFDPAAVERIISQRADIATALAGFRKSRKAADPLQIEPVAKDDEDDIFSPPFGIGTATNLENFQQKLDDYSKSMDKAAKVTEALKKDPSEALRLAKQLPDNVRAEALAVVAAATLKTDPALANSVLDSCVNEIESVPDAASRIPALVKVGGIYATLKDPARASAAYQRAMMDSASLWALDNNNDHPNVAPRDQWPSVQAMRLTAYEAASHLGVSAEGLLSQVPVADLAVLAHIQIARALLSLPVDIHNMSVRWVEKDKR